MPRPGYTKYLGRSRVTRGVSFRIDARTRKNVGVDPQEPSRDETGVDATGVALNEVQLGELAINVEGGAKSGHPAAMDQGSQTLILG